MTKRIRMKKLIYCLSILAVIGFSACQNDDDESPTLPTTLSYDGDNATGPLLPAGEYEAAVRFPSSILDDYKGRDLVEASFFIGILPAGCVLKIYGEGSTGSPGDLIFEADVTNDIVAGAWNRLTLGTPIEITGEDIWISVALTHDQTQQSIGCDAGPNQANGDWLYQSSDNAWEPYIARTGESINWNIRAEVSEN